MELELKKELKKCNWNKKNVIERNGIGILKIELKEIELEF